VPVNGKSKAPVDDKKKAPVNGKPKAPVDDKPKAGSRKQSIPLTAVKPVKNPVVAEAPAVPKRLTVPELKILSLESLLATLVKKKKNLRKITRDPKIVAKISAGNIKLRDQIEASKKKLEKLPKKLKEVIVLLAKLKK